MVFSLLFLHVCHPKDRANVVYCLYSGTQRHAAAEGKVKPVYTLDQVKPMVAEMSARMAQLFPEGISDVVLYGSYARNEAEDGSDVDIMYLVDAPRSVIAQRSWQVGSAAADLLLEYGVVLSPVVENRDYFRTHARTLPFFQNVQREGVRLRD